MCSQQTVLIVAAQSAYRGRKRHSPDVQWILTRQALIISEVINATPRLFSDSIFDSFKNLFFDRFLIFCTRYIVSSWSKLMTEIWIMKRSSLGEKYFFFVVLTQSLLLARDRKAVQRATCMSSIVQVTAKRTPGFFFFVTKKFTNELFKRRLQTHY